MAQMSFTFNMSESHDVTVVYSVKLVGSALVQPSGEIGLVINGTGVGFVNGTRRVDPVYRNLGDYDIVIGNYTELLPAGTYTITLQWRALGIASDWMVNMPIGWTDIMHRELHVIVNPS